MTAPQSPDQLVTEADAERGFSSLLRGVQEGLSYVVTSRGRPVARIVPVAAMRADKAAHEARRAFIAELKARPAVDIGPWTRDELHED